ncbi:VWA domain-containing protein, partial [Bifidobacterium sp.]|uniref:VWA domain-containing protein n=1 Tax=Bifidobacterium sp. TaxID=41200 RepID=UPI003D7C7A7D
VALHNLPDDRDDYTVSIVLLTDGKSKTTNRDEFTRLYKAEGKGIPIYSVMVGDADRSQLDDLAKLSNGKVFDGRNSDLSGVFREVKGYN